MFRSALAGGNSTNLETVAGGSQVRKTIVYKTHHMFLWIAVAISAIASLIVLTTFHGYWYVILTSLWKSHWKLMW